MEEYLNKINDIVKSKVAETISDFEPAISVADDESKKDLIVFAYNPDFEVSVGHRRISDLIIGELRFYDDHLEGIEHIESMFNKMRTEVERYIQVAKKNLKEP